MEGAVDFINWVLDWLLEKNIGVSSGEASIEYVEREGEVLGFKIKNRFYFPSGEYLMISWLDSQGDYWMPAQVIDRLPSNLHTNTVRSGV